MKPSKNNKRPKKRRKINSRHQHIDVESQEQKIYPDGTMEEPTNFSSTSYGIQFFNPGSSYADNMEYDVTHGSINDNAKFVVQNSGVANKRLVKKRNIPFQMIVYILSSQPNLFKSGRFKREDAIKDIDLFIQEWISVNNEVMEDLQEFINEKETLKKEIKKE